MMAENAGLSPKDSFAVLGQALLSGNGPLVLGNLYQPIIGNSAFALYNTLLTELAASSEPITRGQLHAYLVQVCNCSLLELYKNRLKLEGIGLLKSYRKPNMTGNYHYLYQLYGPIEPENFFKDPLLSSLLLEAVGKIRYEKLWQIFALPVVNMDSYQPVTKSFGDVFDFRVEKIPQFLEVSETIAENYQFQTATAPKLAAGDFNWLFFQNYLKQNFFDLNLLTEDLKQLVTFFHDAYGYNEMEIGDFIVQTKANQGAAFSLESLKKTVHESYHQTHSERVMPTLAGNLLLEDTAEKENNRRRELIGQGFSKDEIQLILTCESLPPLIFLQETKESLGGFVANDERRTVELLLNSSKLPHSVINILVHYLLVVQRKPKIYQGTAETIANDWSMDQVASPEEAIRKVRKFVNKPAKTAKKKPTYSKNNYGNTAVKRQETLPDWAQAGGLNPATESMSAAEKAAFEERINKITNNRKGGD